MPSPVVAVVDDDVAVGRAIVRLLRSDGMKALAFEGAEGFLSDELRENVGCLILDVMMPGMDGLALHRRLAAIGATIPTIFITAIDDPRSEAAARTAGALAFLRKPFDDEALLAAAHRGLEMSTTDSDPNQRSTRDDSA